MKKTLNHHLFQDSLQGTTNSAGLLLRSFDNFVSFRSLAGTIALAAAASLLVAGSVSASDFH
jgi:hypothetical protein